MALFKSSKLHPVKWMNDSDNDEYGVKRRKINDAESGTNTLDRSNGCGNGSNNNSTGPSSTAQSTTDIENDDGLTTNILSHIRTVVIKSLWNSKFGPPFHYANTDQAFQAAISSPLDLTKIRNKINECRYKCSDDCLNDIRQMLCDFKIFYGPNHSMYDTAIALERLFHKKVQQMPPSISELKELPSWVRPQHRLFAAQQTAAVATATMATAIDANSNFSSDSSNLSSAASSSSSVASDHGQTSSSTTTTMTDSNLSYVPSQSSFHSSDSNSLPASTDSSGSSAGGSGSSAGSGSSISAGGSSSGSSGNGSSADSSSGTVSDTNNNNDNENNNAASVLTGKSAAQSNHKTVSDCVTNAITSVVDLTSAGTSSQSASSADQPSTAAPGHCVSSLSLASNSSTNSSDFLSVSSTSLVTPSSSLSSLSDSLYLYRHHQYEKILLAKSAAKSQPTLSVIVPAPISSALVSSYSATGLLGGKAATTTAAAAAGCSSNNNNASTSTATTTSSQLTTTKTVDTRGIARHVRLIEVCDDSDDDVIHLAWSCPDCTFLNHPEIDRCECCDRRINIIDLCVTDIRPKPSTSATLSAPLNPLIPVRVAAFKSRAALPAPLIPVSVALSAPLLPVPVAAGKSSVTLPAPLIPVPVTAGKSRAALPAPLIPVPAVRPPTVLPAAPATLPAASVPITYPTTTSQHLPTSLPSLSTTAPLMAATAPVAGSLSAADNSSGSGVVNRAPSPGQIQQKASSSVSEAVDLDMEDVNDEAMWSCARCTFKNHPLLNVCECCGFNPLAPDVILTAAPDKPLWQSLPLTWSVPKSGVASQKVMLDPTDPEYMEVLTNVNKTAQQFIKQIVSIQRIENPNMYTLYTLRRTQMEEENGTGVNNERMLFHGTPGGTVEIICNRGFNRSYCGKNATAWGKGVYFARDFFYSLQPVYSPPDKHKLKHVFQCRVLTGHHALGNPTYIEPPIRDKRSYALYNSVVDNVADPSIFVIFHDVQSYPEYLISFRI